MWVIALVSTLVAQTPAPASAEAEIERGRLLIRDLYEEKALEVLAPYLADEALEPPTRARALIYAGIAQMNLGDDGQGKAMFARALTADIGAVLPEWVSRKVRVAFAAELDTALAARGATPSSRIAVVQEKTTRLSRHPWVRPTLFAGAAVAVAFSALGFIRWGDIHERAVNEPVALTSQQVYEPGRAWFVAGEVTAILGGALLVAALCWWLWPGE